MDEVAIDVEQDRAVLLAVDDVRVPDLVVERSAGHLFISPCATPFPGTGGVPTAMVTADERLLQFIVAMTRIPCWNDGMDFPSLATFVAVAEHGSFSRAAERLFATQPAVSKRVAALEADLGVALIDRLGRGIRLTEAGETFLVSARRLLADARASREEVRALGSAVTGRLRLGTSHHVGIHRLPPVLRAFTQAHPGVDLDLLFMDSEQACAEVAGGGLELAIVTLPDRADATLETALVWPDPLVVVVAPEHPLTAAAGAADAAVEGAGAAALEPARLSDHPAVLPGRGTVTRTILLEALAPFDIAVSTSLETNYLETIKMMVSVGLGWSALPASMVDESVVALPVAGLVMQRRLGSVRLRGRTLSRAAEALVTMLPSGNVYSALSDTRTSRHARSRRNAPNAATAVIGSRSGKAAAGATSGATPTPE